MLLSQGEFTLYSSDQPPCGSWARRSVTPSERLPGVVQERWRGHQSPLPQRPRHHYPGAGNGDASDTQCLVDGGSALDTSGVGQRQQDAVCFVARECLRRSPSDQVAPPGHGPVRARLPPHRRTAAAPADPPTPLPPRRVRRRTPLLARAAATAFVSTQSGVHPCRNDHVVSPLTGAPRSAPCTPAVSALCDGGHLATESVVMPILPISSCVVARRSRRQLRSRQIDRRIADDQ
jgi:hypothetical protein